MTDKTIYKIIFMQQNNLYELYAGEIGEDELLGFIQVSDIVLAEPSEEKIKNEFSGVETTLIPMQAVLRIDIVSRQGPAKIVKGDTNIHHLPSCPWPRDKK